jgi:hypothetical protein
VDTENRLSQKIVEANITTENRLLDAFKQLLAIVDTRLPRPPKE